VPIDAQQCLGFNDAPMSEFWAWSWRHRVGDANRFFVKQPASAAHSYGRKLVLAEGFTTIGPHWQETLWDNLKPAFDHAGTEGLNLLVWHAFVCSPASEGIPGQQYFAGTHLNPNVTWWEKSEPFFSYLNRCQFLLQQGLSWRTRLITTAITCRTSHSIAARTRPARTRLRLRRGDRGSDPDTDEREDAAGAATA